MDSLDARELDAWERAKKAGQASDWEACREAAHALIKRDLWCGYYCMCRCVSVGKAEANEMAPPAAGSVLRHLPSLSSDVQCKHIEAVLTAWNAGSTTVGHVEWYVDDASALQVRPLSSEGPLSSIHSSKPTASHIHLPPLIVLVGYPGCGKSTFAQALVASNPSRIVRVNRDEMRAKGELTKAAESALRSRHTLVVDMCNLTVAHRKEWLSLAVGTKAWCVFFGFDLGECRERISRRVGHPTLKSKADGLRALAGLEGVLEVPTEAEGFERIDVVLTDFALNALLTEWGSEPIPAGPEAPEDMGLVKFPRTAHIANLGAATRDDKILSNAEVAKLVNSGLPVYVTEKVDGANIGLSISPEGKIRVQNRGHFVDSTHHEQFKPLDKWVAKHMEDLWHLLGDEPDRYILFGEWLYAQHSVVYEALPDYFLAFDMYDKVEDLFWPHDKLMAKLAETTINCVPLIAHRPLNGMDDLLALLRGPTAHGVGQREGVVVRLCDEKKVVLRGKLVCAEFHTGLAAGRWNRSGVKPNQLSPVVH